MRVVQINAFCGQGSTGKIAVSVSEILRKQGIESYILYPNGKSDYRQGICYATPDQIKRGALESRIKGNWGFEGSAATKSLIQKLDALAPDVIHLHNIHSHACNLEMLFGWIKKRGVKVIWTFHDCWAYTGYCMYYDAAQCFRWQSGCGNCPQKKKYSWFFDRSKALLEKKKKLYSGLDLTVVTPSGWLAEQVKMSFLGGCPVKVIHNGIDLEVFRPTPSDFIQTHQLGGFKIILGVAMVWEDRKGLDVFRALSNRLGDDYRIVLVGVSAKIGSSLPETIIAVDRTGSRSELAGIYSSADVFVNPTREDNFPTVNIEALACGTPVITFDTGGSPEIADDTCGVTVGKNDIDGMEAAIRRICETKPFSPQACVARAKLFDSRKKFSEYAKLY